MIRKYVLLASLATLAGCRAASEKGWSRSVISTFSTDSSGGPEVVVNRQLIYVQPSRQQSLRSYKDIMLEQVQTSRANGTPWRNHSVHTVAYEKQGKAFTKKLWVIDGPYQHAGMWALTGFYELTVEGCCEYRDRTRYHNVHTGHMVADFASLGQHKCIEFVSSDSTDYMVSYVTASTSHLSKYEDDSLYVGTLTLASTDSVLSRIAIYGNSDSTARSARYRIELLVPKGDGTANAYRRLRKHGEFEALLSYNEKDTEPQRFRVRNDQLAAVPESLHGCAVKHLR